MTEAAHPQRANALTALAVFAHNEERNIVACLDSLAAAGCGADVPVHVLINGCRDRTAQVVQAYALEHANVRAQIIQKGDKANAWNVFVHELAPGDGVAVFMDGDVRAEKGAIAGLLAALRENPEAVLASAVPASGRNCARQVEAILRTRGVQGNLYAARASFLKRFRERDIRMPVGYVREDGLIGSLAAWDLNPAGKWDPQRVVPVAQSRFIFDSIPVCSASGARTYWRRRIRYSLGYFETDMLRQVLKSKGPEGMPATVEQLYSDSAAPALGWRGLNTLFDWFALRRIRGALRHARSA